MLTERRYAGRVYKARSAQRHGPFNHKSGQGYVKYQPGQYYDALRRKRSRVVLILTEVQGGIHARTLAAYRRWAQRARGGGAGTDRTKYGTTRRSTQQHFKHHTQMLSKTAVVENAKAMCRALTKIKAKLHAADAAPMGAGMRA